MKFERKKSVKDSLSLGVFSLKEYKDDYEAWDYINSVIEQIWMRYEGGNLIDKIEEYVKKYVKVLNDGYQGPNWNEVGMADPSLMGLIVPEIASKQDEIQKRLRSAEKHGNRSVK